MFSYRRLPLLKLRHSNILFYKELECNDLFKELWSAQSSGYRSIRQMSPTIDSEIIGILHKLDPVSISMPNEVSLRIHYHFIVMNLPKTVGDQYTRG